MSKARISAETLLEIENARVRIESVTSVVKLTILAALLYGCVQLMGEAAVGVARELAGRNTEASIVFEMLNSVNLSVSISWVFGVCGVACAVAERNLRKQAIQRYYERVRALEELIDSKRTSSNLARGGQTNPKDK